MEPEWLKELKVFWEARPFRPFNVVLNDGRELLVDEPYFIGWSLKRRELSWSNFEDTFDHVEFSRVVGVRPVTAAPGAQPKQADGPKQGKKPRSPRSPRKPRDDG